MSRGNWADLSYIGFDLESTSPDPFDALVVQAAAVKVVPGQDPITRSWLVDPGVEIPAEAAAVHGITTEHARANATHPVDLMLSEVTGILARSMQLQWPVVVMNAAYDLTLVETENARHQIEPLAGRVAPLPIGPIIDPMVLDKQADKFRKGCYRDAGCDPENKIHTCSGCRGSSRDAAPYFDCGGCGATDRTLSSLCRHYGVELTAAHDASADALAAVQLAIRILTLFPDFRGLTPGGLHMAQIRWRWDQQVGPKGLASWFRSQGNHEAADSCSGEWPVQTTSTPTHQEALIP